MDMLPESIRSSLMEQAAKIAKAASPGGAGPTPMQEMYNSVMGFVHAVNWAEPLVLSIVAFVALLYVAAALASRHSDAQIAVFVVVCGLAYVAPLVSPRLSPYWREIATQDYFDEHGYFGSFMVTLPLLFLAFLQMVRTCASPLCGRRFGVAARPRMLWPGRSPRPVPPPAFPPRAPQVFAFCRASSLLVSYKRKQLGLDKRGPPGAEQAGAEAKKER